MEAILVWGIPLLSLIFLVFIFILLKRNRGLKGLLRSEAQAKEILARAAEEVEKIKKLAEAEVQEKDAARQAEFELQTREKRRKLSELERRLLNKEEALERRLQNLERKERELSGKERRLYVKEKELESLEQKINETLQKQTEILEHLSGLSQEEAKNMLIRRIEDEAKLQAAQAIRRIEEETREKSKALAKEIISNAVQRSAADHVVETTVSVVDLPSDDMKGRIIGREGRNIRALEMATGVDIIVDDTPEAVILSSFDPLRRELAKMAIEKLVADGRIHPARIEDIVEQVKVELEEKIKQEGENTLYELGIQNMHPELVKYLGKLKYRTSYGQNVLQHSKEVARLSALMAKELGAEVNVALRAGLLHDIGKAVDKDYEGTHTELSVELTKKYGESEAVIQAIASHHRDIDFPSVEAVLVQAADTLSAARPGARRELLETYIQRLEKLEQIATSFDGVAKAFALQAGREIRIIVDAQKISDDRATVIARDIAQKIKDELDYPGQIKVMVIREMRAVEYAK
ncbi:MAG: ribonuclease Y [Acidobacteriota bacterium]|nr:ribonuclease Y [Acidobacteriota bacterium]MDW3228328.1 ribonuclease Y [Acidobacteriota bacterium]